MKITKRNTNRYNSRLDGLKMKIYKTKEKHIFTIINVYAPRTALLRKDNTILLDLYLCLTLPRLGFLRVFLSGGEEVNLNLSLN